MDKTELNYEIIEVCEDLLDDIESEKISTSTALLRCLKIARLSKDTDAMIWLGYEYGGYPVNFQNKIEYEAFEIGIKHGRKGDVLEDGSFKLKTKLASELESLIAANQVALKNYVTGGVSVSGDFASTALYSYSQNINIQIQNLRKSILDSSRLLSILRSEYYDYALKKSIELKFSNVAGNIFDNYQHIVNTKLSMLSKDVLLKLQALEDVETSCNPEHYSQALLTCRRLFNDISSLLFKRYYPNFEGKLYRTKSGDEKDITGDHTINRLAAVIEYLEDKTMKNSLVGSDIRYLLDWIDNISRLQSSGVHNDITKEEAEKCIIQTYITVGELLRMDDSLK